jgi:hypothetical protein
MSDTSSSVDEDDRSFVVAARAGVAQHRGRPQAAPLDLGAESLEELAAALGAAAALPGCRAHEDLSKPRHDTNSKSRRGLFQARTCRLHLFSK